MKCYLWNYTNQRLKNSKKRKVCSRFKDNVLAADLAEMGSLSSKNLGVTYLLCVMNVFTKHAWVKPFKGKKAKTVLSGFTEIVNESKCKPNKLQLDQRKEFYNNPMQKWLYDNDTLMYSTHNESKEQLLRVYKNFEE